MKKSILLLSLFLLLLNVNNIFSQNITIKGKIQKPIVNNQQSESLVRLLTFNDMLTFEQTTISETKSDKDGNFTIEADIEEITLAQIAIDLERAFIINIICQKCLLTIFYLTTSTNYTEIVRFHF